MPKPRPLPNDRLIGERLRQYRVRARMTLEELAPLGHCSPAQLDRYESGANAIPAGRLQLFSSAMGVEISAFYTDLPLSRLVAHAVRAGHPERASRPAADTSPAAELAAFAAGGGA